MPIKCRILHGHAVLLLDREDEAEAWDGGQRADGLRFHGHRPIETTWAEKGARLPASLEVVSDGIELSGG